MRILIVEDERPTAEDIQAMIRQILGKQLSCIHIEVSLQNALDYLSENPIDVLLLDLNLNQRDGFEILKQAASQSFHTIIISAYADRAVEAFEYGVLDFVPKPYSLERLQIAFSRLQDSYALGVHSLKYLSVRKFGSIQIISLADVRYFKGANVYTELHLNSGAVEIYDKSLKNIKKLLPKNYQRIHKSFIVDIRKIKKLYNFGGGSYALELESGDKLPVSRKRFLDLKAQFDLSNHSD